ncbi:tail fiber [Caudoviricetes sp.]|nr:tail fiber [Caudoviricetes sp.]
MAYMLFANNAATTLASSLSNSATSMSVASSSAFPSPTSPQYFYCTLIDAATNSVIEIVKVTAVSGTTWTIVRAQDGTTANSYIAGDKVELRLVRASLNDFPKLDENNTFTGVQTVNQINLNTGFVPTSTPTGAMWWDGGATPQVQMDANVSMGLGQDMFIYVKASAAITKGQVCSFTGAVGASGVITAAPSTSSNTTQSRLVIGIAAESIALNGFGFIQTLGVLQGINTSSYTAGSVLYYDPTTTGGLTATEPTGIAVKITMAAVINSNSSNGSLQIRPTFDGAISDLADAYISSPTTGQMLYYNGTYWTNPANLTYTPSTGVLSAPEVLANNGLVLNSTTVNTSYTISTGTNAVSVGPISVATGQTVTVSTGSRWVVL